MKLDPSSGKMSEHHKRIRTERLRGCNNLHRVTNGDLYFTDQGQSDLQRPDGHVFRLTPDDQAGVFDRLRREPKPRRNWW